MGHFTDTFRVKIDAEACCARLSVRSVDERVDEHIIDVRDFNAATQEVTTGWCGTDIISTKRAGKDVMIAIRESELKRIIYRVSHQHWRIVCEQFISEVRTSGIEIQPYLVKDQPTLPIIPIEDIVDAVNKTVVPTMLSQFALIQSQIEKISKSNLIQVTAIKGSNESSNAIFIPNDLINTDLQGRASVETDETSSNAINEALAALKNLKKEDKS
jgi:hypothetical protein